MQSQLTHYKWIFLSCVHCYQNTVAHWVNRAIECQHINGCIQRYVLHFSTTWFSICGEWIQHHTHHFHSDALNRLNKRRGAELQEIFTKRFFTRLEFNVQYGVCAIRCLNSHSKANVIKLNVNETHIPRFLFIISFLVYWYIHVIFK